MTAKVALFALCGFFFWPRLSPAQSSSGLASLPPFDDLRQYSVSGRDLNLWRTASIAQDEKLRKALQDLDESERTFSKALEQVNLSRTLFDEYRLRTEVELWIERLAVVGVVIYAAAK